MIYGLIKAVVDVIVIIKVVFIRKRRETFIILVTLLDLIANLTATIGSFMLLKTKSDWEDLPKYQPLPSVIFAVNHFTFMMTH